LLAATHAGADEPEQARPKAPGDASIFESDMAGAYFVARPLKEKYDDLLKRVGELRTEIDEATIDESQARRQIEQLQAEIEETIRQINKARHYIPGATIENRAASRNIPLGAGDLLFVEAENVEIRGGEGPEVKCVIKKTVLSELGKEQDSTADFDGIELVVAKSSGKEKFGYYKDAASR